MKKPDAKKLFIALIPIILALISIFVISKYATSTEFHEKTIRSLDEKRETVMELTAASTAASAAISLIPGDAATPIAEKLADLSTYFLLVICAIYLEKYLVTITGYAAFIILIPVACVLCSINIFYKNYTLSYLARKLIVFGIAIVLVIPASVKVSDIIEATYRSSIDQTIESATQTTEEIEESSEDTDEKDSDKGLLSGLVSKVKDNVTDVTDKVQNVLNDFIEALAVMLVTSCVIPIVVLLFFVWLVKIIVGVDIPLPGRRLSQRD